MYIFMHYEMVTINLIIICLHTNYDSITDQIPYAVYCIPVAYLFYYWRFVPLNPLHLFNPPSLALSPLASTSSLYLGVCFHFGFLSYFVFKVPHVSEVMWCLSFSDLFHKIFFNFLFFIGV